VSARCEAVSPPSSELLHREGRSIRDAARQVAQAIPEESPVWGSGTPSWKAVKRWRDYEARVEGSHERTGYEAGLALADRLPAVGATEILKRTLQAGV
jgi:hypothetical protein